MYGFQIYVQSCSRPITILEHVRLFVAAHRLVREHRTRIDIAEDHFEGRVTTSGEYSAIGGISGQLFSAEFDSDRGSHRVTFVVREVEFEEAIAFDFPMVDATPFLPRDHGAPADRRHLN
ncbi:hypothetical protein HY480_04605 [Candidatus Uhrbacteria bacterium]|nr:hypothetical protein [Candidatus Uhrbacteria bacterium]